MSGGKSEDCCFILVAAIACVLFIFLFHLRTFRANILVADKVIRTEKDSNIYYVKASDGTWYELCHSLKDFFLGRKATRAMYFNVHRGDRLEVEGYGFNMVFVTYPVIWRYSHRPLVPSAQPTLTRSTPAQSTNHPASNLTRHGHQSRPPTPYVVAGPSTTATSRNKSQTQPPPHPYKTSNKSNMKPADSKTQVSKGSNKSPGQSSDEDLGSHAWGIVMIGAWTLLSLCCLIGCGSICMELVLPSPESIALVDAKQTEPLYGSTQDLNTPSVGRPESTLVSGEDDDGVYCCLPCRFTSYRQGWSFCLPCIDLYQPQDAVRAVSL